MGRGLADSKGILNRRGDGVIFQYAILPSQLANLGTLHLSKIEQAKRRPLAVTLAKEEIKYLIDNPGHLKILYKVLGDIR